MGYLRPTAIIVSASYSENVSDPSTPHWIEVAHAEALRIHDVSGLAKIVTEPTPPAMNNERSFLVAWDGSQEGWEESDRGDACRAAFIAWLREQEYGDGSSPLDWIEVQYGGDDGEAIVLDHADAHRSLF
jgi:hypothetical protein